MKYLLKKQLLVFIFLFGCIVATQAEIGNVSNLDIKTEITKKKKKRKVKSVVETAKELLGSPYKSGGKGPKSFDCSGFTSYVFKCCGYQLASSSSSQFTQGKSIKQSNLEPGDLVFFRGSNKKDKSVGHVGIVVSAKSNGDFSFIHAASNGVVIDLFSKSKYYQERYSGARRIIR